MKVLITGAHFTPAVAVIGELKKYPQVEIVYVGRETSMEGDQAKAVESEELPKLGVKFISITTGRLQRFFSFYMILSLLKIPIGFVQSFYIILSQKPDVVLSFGGYISVPLIITAWLWSIPIIVHEQTLISGLANKISSLFADKIAISFAQNYEYNPSKAILSGNPLRSQVLQPKINISDDFWQFFKNAEKEKLPTVYITGGNQGSHIINLAVEESLNKLLKLAYIIHQTGDSRYKDFERLQNHQGKNYLVKKWIGDQIGYVYKNADLIVSRAGANTLAEAAYWGIPVLAIPLPHLYKNEQQVNAKFFEKLGLVKILPQSGLSGESLAANILTMRKNIKKLKSEAKKAKQILILDAAKRLALETILLARNRG